MEFTHLNRKGEADMVDISKKHVVHREAIAAGRIYLKPDTIELIKKNEIMKGDVLSVARIAGISAAKKTWDLIPLCHNIPISKIGIDFKIETDHINIKSTAKCDAKTGIEMEALTAVSVAALTIYDMCKAVDKKMEISGIKLLEKKKSEI